MKRIVTALMLSIGISAVGVGSAHALCYRRELLAGYLPTSLSNYPVDHSGAADDGCSGDGSSEYDGPKTGTCWDINTQGECTYGHTIGFPDQCVTRPTCYTR